MTQPDSAGIATGVRRAISRMVLDLRAALEDDFRRQLAALGVREGGIQPLPAGATPSPADSRTREVALAVIQREATGGASHAEALAALVRDSAFTFLNRAVGLRCLEERELLVVGGLAETVFTVDPARGASSLYWRVRNELPSATNPREIWREAIRRACAAISDRVRVLFDPASEYAALFPLLPTLQNLSDALNAPEISPETYVADELLGWVYQYYNQNEKNAVYERLGKGKKIERPEELAAATCLYTERYMVDYLLQNTLGALWVELHPDTRLPQSWPYFVRDPNKNNENEKEPGVRGTVVHSPLPAGEGEGEGRSPSPLSPTPPRRLRTITLLDPACGSGHFLVRAFDLLVAMYREEGIEAEEEIPHLILERNLHGIDIDLRAVQIAALALYLKGCGLAGPDFRPRRINLIPADAVLSGDARPKEYLARFQGEHDVEDLVKGIWRGLKNVREFGSLLHPERAIDEVVKRRREEDARHYPMLQRGDEHWDVWKRDLLTGLREEFERRAQTEDLGRRLFGEEAAKGVSLVAALGARYDVVVANPPYQGSGSLNAELKAFLAKEYKDGKNDLYAAFILRCRDFARPGGRVGMVTQQSWMFLRSFAALRKGVLEKTSLETIAHLGPHAFAEISGEVVNISLFTLRVSAPAPEHRVVGLRLVRPKTPSAKDALLRCALAQNDDSTISGVKQTDFLSVPESPLIFWLRPQFIRVLQKPERVCQIADVRQGIGCADTEQFMRLFWEVKTSSGSSDGWKPYVRGGRYQKWSGLTSYVMDWHSNGAGIKRSKSIIPSEHRYGMPGITYTDVASGNFSCRAMPAGYIFSDGGPAIFPTGSTAQLMAVLNSRLTTFLLRVTSPSSLHFRMGYVANLPTSQISPAGTDILADACEEVKGWLVSLDIIERTFAGPSLARSAAGGLASILFRGLKNIFMAQALLHTCEGINERLVSNAYGLDEGDIAALVEETGLPAGWYPVIEKLDSISWATHPPTEVEKHSGLAERELAKLPRQTVTGAEMVALRHRARALFDAGPGAAATDERSDEQSDANGVDGTVGGYFPIPTETFVEELSQKLKIHPLSVANLLSGFVESAEPITDPFMQRQTEDYFTYVILRVLGYQWPTPAEKELAGGRSIPGAALATDGIIPLVACGDEPTLDDRVRLGAAGDSGDLGAGDSDVAVFRDVTGRDLGEWLRKDFFKRHVQQFKQRPIAWHLTSPEGHFQAFVLYHKLSRATLQSLRTRYAGALVERLRAEQARAKERKDDAKARELQLQIEDIEEFRERIARIERGDELKYRIRCRWKGEEETGRPGPYAPDIDDGVKVNIRPFQEAGLLAMKTVIKKW